MFYNGKSLTIGWTGKYCIGCEAHNSDWGKVLSFSEGTILRESLSGEYGRKNVRTFFKFLCNTVCSYESFLGFMNPYWDFNFIQNIPPFILIINEQHCVIQGVGPRCVSGTVPLLLWKAGALATLARLTDPRVDSEDSRIGWGKDFPRSRDDNFLHARE
jgi:hypothetical protein